MMNIVTLLIGVTLMYATPLIFGARGGVISERSGVVNIGIEGMMTVGAFTGATVGYFSGNPWIGLLCAGIAGGLMGLLHATASVSFLEPDLIHTPSAVLSRCGMFSVTTVSPDFSRVHSTFMVRLSALPT